jgi:O-antigen/teichoic acid export membrane protein
MKNTIPELALVVLIAVGLRQIDLGFYSGTVIGMKFGPQALGIYARAYQLVNTPTSNLKSTIALVIFPALSRLQNDPERLRSCRRSCPCRIR